MRIIAALTSPHQDEAIEKILRHRQEWQPPWEIERKARGAPLGPGGLQPDAAGRGQLGYLSSPERPRRLTAYCRRRQYAVSATEALGILALLPRSTNCPLTWRNRWFTRASSRPLITVLRPFPGPSPWEARGETSYPAGGNGLISLQDAICIFARERDAAKSVGLGPLRHEVVDLVAQNLVKVSFQ